MVQSINSDCYGSSDAGQLAAADWSAWRQMVVVDGKRDLLAEWRIERIKRSQSPAARLAKVETMRDSLAAGRGRRAALADKVKHASLLLISGMESDKAAAAAGFKESASSRGHGKMRASDRLAAALTRAGRPVKTLRTMANDDFKAAARRGGAGVDLAALFSFAVPSLPFVPCPIVPVVVPACHPLDKATSGLPFGVEIGGESRKVLASPRLTLAVASRTLNARKLRGVVRPVFGRPARVAVRDAVLPVVHPVPVVATGSRRSPRGWQAPKVVVGSKVVVVGHGRLLQANEIYYLGLQWAGMVSL